MIARTLTAAVVQDLPALHAVEGVFNTGADLAVGGAVPPFRGRCPGSRRPRSLWFCRRRHSRPTAPTPCSRCGHPFWVMTWRGARYGVRVKAPGLSFEDLLLAAVRRPGHPTPARERTELCAPTLSYGAQVPNGRRGGSSACCVGLRKLRRQREHPGCSWTATHQRRETREPREFRPRGRHRRYRRRHGHPQRGNRPCADRRPAGSRWSFAIGSPRCP